MFIFEGTQTLGEEYCDIVPVNGFSSILSPPLRVIITFLIFQLFYFSIYLF
jgi:hypothetical protein